jgi:type IV secretory pathway VirB10-like protein
LLQLHTTFSTFRFYMSSRQVIINQLVQVIRHLERQIIALRNIIDRLREEEDDEEDSDIILVDAELIQLVHAQVQQSTTGSQAQAVADQPTLQRNPPAPSQDTPVVPQQPNLQPPSLSRRELREDGRRRAQAWAQQERERRASRVLAREAQHHG